MKNKTLRKQITGMTIFVVIFTIGLVFLLNTTLLEKFYMSHKVDVLESVFHSFDEKSKDESLYKNDYLEEFLNLCQKNSISCMVMRPDGGIRLSSQPDNQRLVNHLFAMAFSGGGETIGSFDTYSIFRFSEDNADRGYLVLWGNMSDGNTAFIESPIESIRDSVLVTNRFLLIAGVVAIIIGVIISFGLTFRLLRPLNKLSKISERMGELDFEARYVPGKVTNEIDDLGLRMNELSELLSKNILDLKEANSKLRTDLKLKEKNEEMRREFISNISHELKTPISLILGYADGLLDEGILVSEEKKKEYAEIIVDEAERMDELIIKLLELNELEYGKQEIQMSRINLSKIIEDEVFSVLVLAENADVYIDNTISEEIYVLSDEYLVSQVVENYLTNAIKYAEEIENKKLVRLSATKDKEKTVFTVFNTASPIDEEDLKRLWDKFYRIDRARTHENNSTGIGLSIVKAAAETLECSCDVKNVLGGIEFSFTFFNNF